MSYKNGITGFKNNYVRTLREMADYIEATPDDYFSESEAKYVAIKSINKIDELCEVRTMIPMKNGDRDVSKLIKYYNIKL